MQSDVPNAVGFMRPILNFSHETKFDHSINDLMDPKVCTVDNAQT